MHLIELIEKLEAVKIARGNILLVDVLIVASGDRESIVDVTSRRKPVEAEPQKIIDVTGLHEDQVDELRAENPGAKLVRRTVEPKEPAPADNITGAAPNGETGTETGKVVTMALSDLEGKSSEVEMPCPQWDGKGKACTLAFGHEGDHRFPPPPGHIPEAAQAAAEPQSNPGDARLPETLQE